MTLTINFGGLSTPTVSVTTGNVTNNAAGGTPVGNLTTSLSGATAETVYGGGQAITNVGNQFQVNAIGQANGAVDRRYRRTIPIEAGAVGNISGAAFDIVPQSVSIPTVQPPGTSLTVTNIQGAIAVTQADVNLQSTTPISIPIVEATAASLTVSRTGSTLTLPEFNDTLYPDNTANSNYLATYNATGATGALCFNIISENCPVEIDQLTGIAGMTGFCTTSAVGLGGIPGVHYFLGPTINFTVRVQDAAGNWGVYNDSVTITARSDLSGLPNVGVVDPANATLAGSTVVSALCYVNGTPYTMVNQGTLTVASYVGPDGNTRNVFVMPNTSVNVTLAAGSAYAGSSAALVALFAQTNISNTNGSDILVMNVLGSPNYGPGGHIVDGSGFGITNGMRSDGKLNPEASNASGVALFNVSANALSTGWQTIGAISDGNILIQEQAAAYGPGAIFSGQYSSGSGVQNPILPQTNSFTPTAITLANAGAFGSGSNQIGLWIIAPHGLTIWEREVVYAYCARKFGISFTPLARKVTNGMLPTLQVSNFNTMFGTTKFRPLQFFHYQDPANVGVGAINNEVALYVAKQHANVSAIFPDWDAYVDTNGHLILPLYALTPAQITWLTANITLPHAISFYGYRGAQLTAGPRIDGATASNAWLQYLMFCEANAKLPLGQGLTPTSMWWYGSTGGPEEGDVGEQFGCNPSVVTFTMHFQGGGSTTNPFFAGDNAAIAPKRRALDWIDNLDGVHHTYNWYYERRLFASNTVVASTSSPHPMYYLMTMTSVDGGLPPNGNTPIGNLASAMQVYSWRVWAPVNSDFGQCPQLQQVGSISGTRGNGNTLTYTPSTYNWTTGGVGGVVWKWVSYTPAAGFTSLTAFGTATFSDLTSLQGETLAIIEYAQSSSPTYPPLTTTVTNNLTAFIEPGVLPNASVSTDLPTGTTGTAQGTVLGWLIGEALGASFSINPSDTSGNFQLAGGGNVQIQAGPNWHTNASGTPVSLFVIQTALLSGPTPLSQTLSLTPN